jgi:large subunit ribosomal protein L19
MNVASLVEMKKNPKIPDIAPGDTVKVSARIVEGGKERIQVFQGVILKIRRGGAGASFTVRHVAFGIGVERTFPFNSSLVEKVEIVRQGKVRRSRLYYLRGLSGKEARRKIKRVERKLKQVGEELLQAPPEEAIEPMPEEVVEQKPVAAATEPVPAAKATEVAAEKAPVEKPAVKEPEAKTGKEKAPASEKTAVKEPEASAKKEKA